MYVPVTWKALSMATSLKFCLSCQSFSSENIVSISTDGAVKTLKGLHKNADAIIISHPK